MKCLLQFNIRMHFTSIHVKYILNYFFQKYFSKVISKTLFVSTVLSVAVFSFFTTQL